MRSYFLRAAGLTAMVLALQFSGSAQMEEHRDTLVKGFGDNDEIVIKPKIDVDVKLNVEIKKDGQVLVNGKPVDEFEDANVSVRKKKVMVMDGRTITLRGMHGMDNPDDLMGPDGPLHKGGGWSMDGEETNRPFLGVVSVKPVDDQAAGARVKEITGGSAAEKAGLKAGDLITRIDEIIISDPESLSKAIHKYKPEDKITLTYTRDGKEQKTTATLGKFKGGPQTFSYNFQMPKTEPFEFQMPPMPPFGDGDAHAFSWNDGRPKIGIRAQDVEDGKGAKVLGVDENSPADKAGIKEGDVITRFDGKDVENATMLADLARETKGKASVKISVTHDGKSREIEVKVPKKLRTADL